jgi:hypothetical protein
MSKKTIKPNATTIQAIQEVSKMKKNPSAYKGYSDIKKMFKDILGGK